ncbi:1,4-dihydroxy-2-naphthoate octaprenyltransferase [Pigmentibacter sp. JX0631]|uniref:1,4-dihydroxy-2-naphthoate octaprenyltransferase n=1 Tax=Pigmentibacter sp. JX0631 TaxID=2976982 RepID=UPI0024695675|nr:1,4-dihydroxy-2-naphthoate octaprenyltransferase [Pigmentibacter sp. JX0631]WGL61280.1 1,4-dihydroxy-2-naphthoate octaprenyltransferase [Pigmentibacter sp. JX0631]
MSDALTTKQGIYPWLLAARPKTLSAAVTPILISTMLSFHYSLTVNYQKICFLSILALFSTIFIQIGTNLINDALDFKKGADNENRLGPKRVTQSGLLSAKQVMIGGFLSFLISVLLAIPLVLHSGFPIIVIGLVALLFGYLYTGGPYPLAYKGLGELFVILFFGLVAVGGVFYLQTGFLNTAALIAGLEVGLLATVLISINNYRDYLEDRKVRKMTLAARFGPCFAKYEILFLYFSTYSIHLYWFYEINSWSALLPFVTLPLAIKIVKDLFHQEPSRIFNKYLGMSALLQLLFGILFSIGILIG